MQPQTSGVDVAPALEVTGYRAGDLLIDLGRAVASRGDAEIPLPRLSFDLLVALARAAPNVATIEELMRQVWPRVIVNPETVSQRVKLLRGALGDDPHEPRYVAGVRGRGYRLSCAVTPLYESVEVAEPHSGSTRKRAPVRVLLVAAAVGAGLVMWTWLLRSPVPPAATSLLPPRSIAVLAFRDLNGDHADDILALGIPEALLHQLASFGNLEVIARTSSFSFQGHDQDIRVIGRQLGARYILEGSVQRDQQRLRVTAQLVDAESGGHIWSMRFDKTPQNVFELQDAIALEVARALSISLQAGELPRKQESTSFEAYLEYLQGSRLLDTWRRADMKAAGDHAARAIAIDPQYADAMILLARANVRVGEYDTSPGHERRFREVQRAALALLDHALSLNPHASRAYAERGYINAFSDLAVAETDFRRALDLDSSDVQALEELAAVVYESPARRGEALALIDKAIRLDPLEPRLGVIKATYLFYGRSDAKGAEKLLQDALQLNPLFLPALARLAEVYWIEGRFAEGIKIAEQVVAADSTAAQSLQLLQNLYLEIQDVTAAEQVTRSVSPPSPVLMAALLLAKGRWSDAGLQTYRAISLGAITPIAEPLTIAALRLSARATGRYRQAMNVLAERSQTEWDAADQPIVHDSGYVNVVGLADLLIQSGQAPRGRRLLDATLAAMDHEATVYRRGRLWQHPMRPVALALLGRNDEAIAELRSALVTRHELNDWWYFLGMEPAYEQLRHDPRFQEIVRVAREHAAREREALEQLRANNIVPDRSRGAVVRNR